MTNTYSQTVGALTASVRLLGAYDNQTQGTKFVSDAFVLDRLSRNYKTAYELLASADAERLTTTQTYTVGSVGDSIGDSAPAQSGSYVPYPDDCYRLRRVEVLVGIQWLALLRDDMSPLNSPWELPFGASIAGLAGVPARYRSEGQRIYLAPAVASGQQLRLAYVPSPVALTGSNQAIDCTAGTDELAVWMTVRDCRVREDRDTREADVQVAAERQRIAAMARDRDSGQPRRLEDPLTSRAGRMWRRSFR